MKQFFNFLLQHPYLLFVLLAMIGSVLKALSSKAEEQSKQRRQVARTRQQEDEYLRTGRVDGKPFAASPTALAPPATSTPEATSREQVHRQMQELMRQRQAAAAAARRQAPGASRAPATAPPTGAPRPATARGMPSRPAPPRAVPASRPLAKLPPTSQPSTTSPPFAGAGRTSDKQRRKQARHEQDLYDAEMFTRDQKRETKRSSDAAEVLRESEAVQTAITRHTSSVGERSVITAESFPKAAPIRNPTGHDHAGDPSPAGHHAGGPPMNGFMNRPVNGRAHTLRWNRGVVPALLVAAPLIIPISGCGENAAQMAESESVLAPLFTRTTPLEAAAWAIDKYDSDKRFRGIMLLANAPWGGADAYIPYYEVALTDEAPAVRAAALRGLTLHGQPSHVPAITPLLKDADPLVRLEAARSLQRLHNEDAVGPLLEVIKDPSLAKPDEPREASPDIRAIAANALGQYAQKKVLDGLVASLDDPDLLVVRNAEQSLRTLTGQAFGEDRPAWVNWLKAVGDPFALRTNYQYPIFQRDKRWFEHLPLVPSPPNEPEGSPVGADVLVAAPQPVDSPAKVN